MRKRSKLCVICLALALIGGMVAVTFSWFIAVNDTPAFAVSSATVDWRPDGGWGTRELLAYGNLAGGYTVDSEGIAHILPSESLLPGYTVTGGVRTTETSIVRPADSDETDGTVIRREIRRMSSGEDVAETCREIPAAATTQSVWSPFEPDTPPTAQNYQIATTSQTTTHTTQGGAEDGYIKIVTTVTTTATTYTPKTAGGTTYVHTLTTTAPVTFEKPFYTGGSAADFQAAPTAGRLERVETVNAIHQGIAHASVTIRAYDTGQPDAAEDAEGRKPAMPLTLGNRSTTTTAVRMSASALLKGGDGTIQALEQQWVGNVCYLGLTNSDGKFIDLLVLLPASGGDYNWSRATAENPTNRAVWDLQQGGGTTIAAAPAVLRQATDEAGNGLVDDAGQPVMEETGAVEEQFYSAFSDITVAGAPHDGGAVSQLEFENSFNELYCIDTPVITLTVTYSARQADYMTWEDFYSISATAVAKNR